MSERDQGHDSERLPEVAARRLLERASELEAARGTELSVAELREAAQAAGIAPGAFEQALAELRERGVTVAAPSLPAPSRLRRLTAYWPAALAAALVLVFVLMRMFP
jgi:hypothetical protein